jgi:hypothetical protein
LICAGGLPAEQSVIKIPWALRGKGAAMSPVFGDIAATRCNEITTLHSTYENH